tara:strand:- start:717 stop:1469 length:753 start_codon:yes stop_codon:yes gene_type:complete
MLDITPIPLLTDNYAYFLEDLATGVTAIIDPSEATGVLTFLKDHNKSLNYILNTHHHHDHTGGNLLLAQKTGATVAGFEKDQHRLPGLQKPLKDESVFKIGQSEALIIFVPGHTLGHIAYYFQDSRALFTGDTLFSLGCGRLFEGTPKQMWTSLQKIQKLPDSTRIYCGHEYTLDNLAFAKHLFPEDTALQKEEQRLKKLRHMSQSTVPSTLKFEKRFNPFLNQIKRPEESGLGDLEVFTLRRHMKDTFS